MHAPDGARVYLARHGQTALNAADRLRGRLDAPLDEIGREQADALATALVSRRPVRVITSPLRRAVETAQPIADRAQVPLVVDDRLADRDYGPWAGVARAEVVAQFGTLDAAPGVEPAAAVIERARAALEDTISHLAVGSVVVVAHDAVNRLLMTALSPQLARGGPLRQPTGCWNVLRRADGIWTVEFVDEEALPG